MNMNRKLARSVATVLATTAVFGTQVMGVCAAPVSAVPISAEASATETTTKVSTISKEALVKYYNENFDVEAYKKAYPDLVAAFGANADPSVYLNHYLEHGMKEGRNAGGFDAIAFIINNYDYFAEHGLDADFPFFNAEKYKAAYPDLAKAFGDDMSLYLQHYLTHGIFENRKSEAAVDLIAFEKAHPDTNIRVNTDITKLKVETVTKMFEQASIIIYNDPVTVVTEEKYKPIPEIPTDKLIGYDKDPIASTKQNIEYYSQFSKEEFENAKVYYDMQKVGNAIFVYNYAAEDAMEEAPGWVSADVIREYSSMYEGFVMDDFMSACFQAIKQCCDKYNTDVYNINMHCDNTNKIVFSINGFEYYLYTARNLPKDKNYKYTLYVIPVEN